MRASLVGWGFPTLHERAGIQDEVARHCYERRAPVDKTAGLSNSAVLDIGRRSHKPISTSEVYSVNSLGPGVLLFPLVSVRPPRGLRRMLSRTDLEVLIFRFCFDQWRIGHKVYWHCRAALQTVIKVAPMIIRSSTPSNPPDTAE
jgi:hypothetical protein